MKPKDEQERQARYADFFAKSLLSVHTGLPSIRDRHEDLTPTDQKRAKISRWLYGMRVIRVVKQD